MLVQHSAIYLAGRIVPSLLSLIGIAIYTRLLDPEGYGLYALIISGAGLAQVCLFEWIRLAAMRYLSSYQAERTSFGSTLTAAFLSMTALLLLCAGVGMVFGFAPSSHLVAGASLALGLALFATLGAVVRADLMPVRFACMTLLQAILMLGIGVPTLFLGAGPVGLVAALTFASMIATLPSLVLQIPDIHLRAASLTIAKKCWSYGLPLSIASGFGLIVMYSDRFLIAWLLDTSHAGNFAAAYWTAAHPISALLVVVGQAALPLTVRAFEREGATAARAQLADNLTLLLALGLPATVGVAVLREEIAYVLLGPDFRAAATPLIPLIALAALLHGITVHHFTVAFQLARETRPVAIVSFTAALLNVGLNLWWIQEFGLIGAALASIAAYAFSLILTWIWGHQSFGLPPPTSDVAKIGLATLAMAPVIWVLPQMGLQAGGPPVLLVLSIFAGVLSYSSALYLLDVRGVRKLTKTYFRIGERL